MQSVFDAGLLFLHFDFGGSTDLDHCNTAGQLGLALLQLFLVVVRGRLFDLLVDLGDATLDRIGRTHAVDDGGFFFANFDALGLTQILQGHFLERQADFLGDHSAAGEDGDVFEHGLAAVAEARCLDGDGLEDAADVVDHQGGQRLTFDVFGDDQQRPAGLGNLLEHRQQVTDVADLLVVQKHERAVQHRHLLVGVVDEVGRQVAAVELHALDHVEFVLQARAVFDGDDAFLADLVHGVGDDLTDGLVRVGRDRTDLGDLLAGGAGLAEGLELGGQGFHSLVDAALQIIGFMPAATYFMPSCTMA